MSESESKSASYDEQRERKCESHILGYCFSLQRERLRRKRGEKEGEEVLLQRAAAIYCLFLNHVAVTNPCMYVYDYYMYMMMMMMMINMNV